MQSISHLLHKLSDDERAALHKLLGTKENNIDQIIGKLGKVLLPANGLWQSPLTYTEFMEKIARHNNIQLDVAKSELAKEQQLFLELFQVEYNKMSAQEQANFLADLEAKGLNRNQITSLAALGTIGAAQASGIGVYLLASSTVGAITSLMGVTLPFAFYTGMSSVISVVIGPVGFLVLGYALYKSFRHVRSINDVFDILSQSYTGIKNLVVGDYDRATLCFKYIASMRVMVCQRIQDEIKDDETQCAQMAQDNIGRHEKRISNSRKIDSAMTEIKRLEEIIGQHRKEIDLHSRDNGRILTEIATVTNNIDELKESIDMKRIELEMLTDTPAQA